MMGRFVMYNGKKTCSYFSNAPSLLSKDKIYEVVRTKELSEQTNLVLKNISGEYCSEWFSEVPVYLGTCSSEPSKSNAFIVSVSAGDTLETSPVISVECLGSNIYQVITKKDVYIVEKVNK